MSRLVLGRNVLVTQLSPHGHDLGEPFDRSVPLHNSCRHNRDILCDQPRIERKKRPEHQAHSRSYIRDACGLPVATEAEL